MPKTTPVTYLATLLSVAQDDLAQARANFDQCIEAKMKAESLLNTATAEAEHYAGKISEIVSAIKTLGGNVKGFKPLAHAIGNVEPETESPDYAAMTVRAGLRAFFLNNENGAATWDDICQETGYKQSTVCQYLSHHPEFVNVGPRTWEMAADFYAKGWTTVGK